MSSLEVVFFRNIFGVLFVVYTLFVHPLKQKGNRGFLLFMRGLFGTLALLFYFYNIFEMNLADAMTFNKTSPIFTAIFAFLLYKERLSKYALAALVFGFLGIVFVIKPSLEFDIKLAITGVLSSILAAMAYTSIRELKDYYETRIIVLSFTGIGTIVPAIFLVLGEFYSVPELDFLFAKFVMPDLKMWFYILMMGFFGTTSQFLMTKAYSLSKAGVVGAASYVSIFIAMFFGVLAGDSLPDALGFIGILLVILAGILVSLKPD